MQDTCNKLRRAYAWFLEALFPPKCIICRKEGNYLCNTHRTFHSAPTNEVDFKFVDNIHAAVKYYDPTTEKLVEFFKFRGFGELADIMGEEIVKFVPKDFWDNAVLVPVPLHWTRKFWRGFNQADLIAQAIGKKIPQVKIQYLLKRHKRTFQQAKLSRDERLQNIRNAFCFHPDRAKRFEESLRYILIDDVVASGATLESAAETLKKSGISKVEALVFARGGK